MPTMSANGGGGPSKMATERDVHVRHVVLDVEEGGVQWAQAVRTHRPSLRGVSGPKATTGSVPFRRGQPALAAAPEPPSEARTGVARILVVVSS